MVKLYKKTKRKCTYTYDCVWHLSSEYNIIQHSNISFLYLGYLCCPDANVYEIDFTRFCIRDLESGTVLFEIAKPHPPGMFSPYRCV